MTGFRTEKQLWKWMKPQMLGTWHRVEAIVPEGFPDLIGIYNEQQYFVEMKVGSGVRPKQRDFLEWLAKSNSSVTVVYGSLDDKKVDFLDMKSGQFTTPPFWRLR